MAGREIEISTVHVAFNVTGQDIAAMRSEIIKRIAELFPPGVGIVETNLSLEVSPEHVLQADDGTRQITMWSGHVMGTVRVDLDA